ncbi:HgcAB-associated protein HgcC [Chloroflexota bacterium]
MAKEEKEEVCWTPKDMNCCRVEALISVDDRGQMILPKDLRQKANIHAGDKLAVTSWGKDGNVFCVILTKAEDLTSLVKKTLEPVMQDILQ